MQPIVRCVVRQRFREGQPGGGRCTKHSKHCHDFILGGAVDRGGIQTIFHNQNLL